MSFRSYCVGAFSVLAGLSLAGGYGAHWVPFETPVSALARIFDSLAPALLGLALIFGLLVWLFGARWIGALLSAAALAAGADLYASHYRLSLPLVPDRTSDLRVVFHNVFNANAANSYQIVEAALDVEADVLVFAEAEALYPALRILRRTHTFVSPCTLDQCELVMAIRKQPIRFWTLDLNPVRPARYAVAEVEVPGKGSAFVVGNHLLKPWLDGIVEPEHAKLKAQYDWLDRPVVVIGDFNAAPWSYSVQDLLHHTGFRALRAPPGTWPVGAGRFGVPIDQVLVHNGARVVDVTTFGDGLGSNHRGLIVDIALP